MTPLPDRIFLDTNVFIIGAADPESPEGLILRWAGLDGQVKGSVEIIVSDEIFQQISRVSKRLHSKDWGSELIGRIWQFLNLRYVLLDAEEISEIEATGLIPREDAGVYLTARAGKAQCFISSNHELVHVLAGQTREFQCFKPEEFIKHYLLP
jgi:predicted nucleic acid-binding protein